MVLNSLYLENFKRYKRAKFDFNLGLSGLLGKNGSGKSTIFEAIIFALYGESKTNKELLKNSNASSKDIVSVKLEFNLNGKDYLIVRELRGKSLSAKAHLYDSSNELIATSVKEVNKELVKLIGMSKEAFVNTVYASQKELTALSNLKSEDRKKIIRKLLGLEKIDKIEKELVIKLRDLKRDIASFNELLLSREEIENLESQKSQLINQSKELKSKIKALKIDLENRLKKVDSALKHLEQQQKLKEEFNTLQSGLELIKTKINSSNKALDDLLKNKNQLEQSQSYYFANRDILDTYKAIEEEILYCQKQKEQIIKKEALQKEQEELREQLKALRTELKKLQEEIAKKDIIEQKKQQTESRLNSLKNSLLKIESDEREILKQIAQNQAIINSTKEQLKKITQLGKNSKCPTCTRPLLDEYESVVSSLSSTINEITENKLKYLKQDLQKIKLQKEKLLKEIEDTQSQIAKLNTYLELIANYQKQYAIKEEQLNRVTKKGLANKQELEKLKDISYNKDKHLKLTEQKKSLEPQYKKLIGIAKLIEELPKIQSKIDKLKQDIKALEQEKLKKEQEIKSHIYKKESEEAAKNSYLNALKLKDELVNKLKEQEISLSQIDGKIATLDSKLEHNTKQLNKLKQKEQDRDDYEKLKLFLSDFKTKINSQVTPRISQIASDMFYELTKGKYQLIEVDKDFNFFIYDEGKKYPIERFSGGEIDLANLVLRIAISKTLNELSSNTNIDFLAFDEVFGSQDEDRRYAIMESFNKISENYRQIFLISHEKEIKEMFQNVIEL